MLSVMAQTFIKILKKEKRKKIMHLSWPCRNLVDGKGDKIMWGWGTNMDRT